MKEVFGRKVRYSDAFSRVLFHSDGIKRMLMMRVLTFFYRMFVFMNAVYLSRAVMLELKRIIDTSKILECDDQKWPEPSRESSEELEVLSGEDHISFAAAKINALMDVQKSKDPIGMRCFYYTTQDIKAFVFSLLQMHFRVKPI